MMVRMDAEPTTAPPLEIDDRFIGQWIDYGMIELTAYLANHLRFERWCEARDS